MEKTTPCECEHSGSMLMYCNRHKCHKTARFVKLCSSDQRYFDAYEEGKGPGQQKAMGLPVSAKAIPCKTCEKTGKKLCEFEASGEKHLECIACGKRIHKSLQNVTKHYCQVTEQLPPGVVKIGEKLAKVINCDLHGMGDLLACATIAESVKGQSPELLLCAKDPAKREVAELFGFTVENRVPVRKMVDTFTSYDWELQNPDLPRVLSRAKGLGYTLADDQIKLPIATIPQKDIDWAKSTHRKDRPLVVLFPLSAYRNREWAASLWIDLGWQLEKIGYEVKTFTIAADARFNEAPSYYHSRPIVEVAAMMKEASLVIGNDSGPVWLSGTLGVKTLALIGPTGPSLFAHLPNVHCVSGPLECTGCFYQKPNYRPACEQGCMSLLALQVKPVLHKAVELLGGS